MITKQEFVDIINRLKDYNDLQNKINDLFDDNIENEERDFMNAGSICVGHETVVVRLLGNMFNDEDTLSWWIYDMDYGRELEVDSMTEMDGTPIDVTTPEKLYDFLLKGGEKGSEVKSEMQEIKENTKEEYYMPSKRTKAIKYLYKQRDLYITLRDNLKFNILQREIEEEAKKHYNELIEIIDFIIKSM